MGYEGYGVLCAFLLPSGVCGSQMRVCMKRSEAHKVFREWLG